MFLELILLMGILFLSARDLATVLTMEDALEQVERAFRAFSSGEAVVPPRSRISLGEGRVQLVMPCYLPPAELGTKIVSVYADNWKVGLPTVTSLYVLNDAETGAPVAVMDGNYLTAMRTGAASGVATNYLANPDATAVGIFGCGAQARMQLLAIKKVRPIQTVRVYDKLHSAAIRFAEEMEKGVTMEVCRPKEVVRKSEIIITATTATKPVFDGRWLQEGTHINAIGAFTPKDRELDDETIQRSKIVVASREAATREAGDILIPSQHGILTELTEIGEVIGGARVREGAGDITLFKSVGLAVQDVVVARLAYEKAQAKDVGVEVEL